MVEKLITKSFERLLDKGKVRGFITYEELGKSLGKRGSSVENVEKAFLIIVDHSVTLVEKKSQYQSNKKKEVSATNDEKQTDKSDDPIRMYLREMGGVELLSREGEIAIAKRIEAGKDVMINALTQSPLVAKKIYEWKEKIESNELLVRDIIDIDSTYEDFEAIDEEKEKIKAEAKIKKNKEEGIKNETPAAPEEEDEFNVSLAKMEEEIRPKIIKIIDNLTKDYTKVSKRKIRLHSKL
jgi:RNA polymerase primary sigma factor